MYVRDDLDSSMKPLVEYGTDPSTPPMILLATIIAIGLIIIAMILSGDN